jgi:hypothetical protein
MSQVSRIVLFSYGAMRGPAEKGSHATLPSILFSRGVLRRNTRFQAVIICFALSRAVV